MEQESPIKQLTKSSDSKDGRTSGTAGLRSALSQQIAKSPSLPNNPFTEYSRFDGRACEATANVKRISIFLTMASEDREKPLEVSVVAGARVRDLIGLVCWLYTNEGRKPALDACVGRYSLRISEENGDVDPDFPGLNTKEPVAKFGFPFLALVQEEEVSPGLVVTV